MSGTLIINDDATWSPSGWIYNDVLERVALELRSDDPPLAMLLLSAQTDKGGFGELLSLTDKQFVTLQKAVERAFDSAASDGPSSFDQPEYYIGFMYVFSEFKALLRSDERASKPATGVGTLVINEVDRWSADSIFFDLALEQMAANAQVSDEQLARTLLSDRAYNGRGLYDARTLSEKRFGLIFSTADWMNARYGDGQGRSSYAPHFFSRLAPLVVKLYTLMHSDPRAVKLASH